MNNQKKNWRAIFCEVAWATAGKESPNGRFVHRILMQQWILSPPMREDDVHRVQDEDEKPSQLSSECRAEWAGGGNKGDLRMRLQVCTYQQRPIMETAYLLSRESHSLQGKQEKRTARTVKPETRALLIPFRSNHQEGHKLLNSQIAAS